MSRSKAPLLLMEQLVMLLVFALAAALCIQGFVLANRRSEENAARDHAVRLAQSTAAVYKATGGDLQEATGGTMGADGLYRRDFDARWQPTAGPDAYCLLVTPLDSPLPQLSRAQLQIFDEDGTELIALSLACQTGASMEVDSHGQ